MLVSRGATFTRAPTAPPGYPGPRLTVKSSTGEIVAHLSSRSANPAEEPSDPCSPWPAGFGGTLAFVGSRPWALKASDGKLLVRSAAVWPNLYDAWGDTTYHVSLAYALPLALNASWRSWAASNIDLLVASQQLVCAQGTDLVVGLPTADLLWRHARLIKRHSGTDVTTHADVSSFMASWCEFSLARYGRRLPIEEVDALTEMLRGCGAEIRDLTAEGCTIARTAVVVDHENGVLFDLMATWDLARQKLSPGRFSAIDNMSSAISEGMAYCMCYGRAPYKDSILGSSRRLGLEELMARGK